MSYQKHPDYDNLDEVIKCAFSPRDYAAMPDEEKKTLLEDMTSPEVEDNA